MHTTQIDLDRLTQDMVDEATPNFGKECFYAAPCIIGTLIPEEHRSYYDASVEFLKDPDTGKELDSTTVGDLEDCGYFEFASPNQIPEAAKLQSAFDSGDEVEFEKLLRKRGLHLKRELIGYTLAL